MKIRTLLLTIFLVIGFSFQNCSSDDILCSCPPLLGKFFDVQGLELSTFKRGETSSRQRVLEGEEVKFSDYVGLWLEFQVDYHSFNDQEKKSWGFSLMNSALACSCIENGYEGSKEEKLNSLTVVTLNDFDPEHLANDTINDLLKVDDFYSNEVMDLNEYLAKDTSALKMSYFELQLKKAPVLNEEYKVKVMVELSTNEVYEVESIPVKITN